MSRQLLAGGNWNNAANAGSRSRNANNYRWNTNTNIGARFASDTGQQKLHLAGSFGLVSGRSGGKTHSGGCRQLVAQADVVGNS